MLTAGQVDLQFTAYSVKLLALNDRFRRGERSAVAVEAQSLADDLICLLEEAPLEKRERIDHLIDRYEALRISCLS
jgi:hypothetical protein